MSGDVADAHNHWTIGKQIKIVVAITRAIVRTFDGSRYSDNYFDLLRGGGAQNINEWYDVCIASKREMIAIIVHEFGVE